MRVNRGATAIFWLNFLFRAGGDAHGTYEHEDEDINCLFHY